MQYWRLEQMGLAKHGETHGMTGMGLGLARRESVGWGFKRVWNRTDPFLLTSSAPLVGYPNLLLTL